MSRGKADVRSVAVAIESCTNTMSVPAIRMTEETGWDSRNLKSGNRQGHKGGDVHTRKAILRVSGASSQQGGGVSVVGSSAEW